MKPKSKSFRKRKNRKNRISKNARKTRKMVGGFPLARYLVAVAVIFANGKQLTQAQDIELKGAIDNSTPDQVNEAVETALEESSSNPLQRSWIEWISQTITPRREAPNPEFEAAIAKEWKEYVEGLRETHAEAATRYNPEKVTEYQTILYKSYLEAREKRRNAIDLMFKLRNFPNEPITAKEHEDDLYKLRRMFYDDYYMHSNPFNDYEFLEEASEEDLIKLRELSTLIIEKFNISKYERTARINNFNKFLRNIRDALEEKNHPPERPTFVKNMRPPFYKSFFSEKNLFGHAETGELMKHMHDHLN